MWKCQTEGLALKSNSHTCDVEHWELQPTRMEQPATLSQVWGLSPQQDLWESLVLRIRFSGGKRIKDNIEPSLHCGPAPFKNLFLLLGKVKKVLLICVDCGEKNIWFSPFSCTSVSHNLLSSCRNPRVRP